MKFSIRDLLLLTSLAALAAGWCVDRSRLVGNIERLQQAAKARPPMFKPASPEAMAAFLTEVTKGDFASLKDATDVCFIPGLPAASHMKLLAKADRTCAPDNPRFPGGVQYEFWCESYDPKELGGSFVCVVCSGEPLRIVEAEVIVLPGETLDR
jgi:hypothetical protein